MISVRSSGERLTGSWVPSRASREFRMTIVRRMQLLGISRVVSSYLHSLSVGRYKTHNDERLTARVRVVNEQERERRAPKVGIWGGVSSPLGRGLGRRLCQKWSVLSHDGRIIHSMVSYTQSTESTEAKTKMLSEKLRLQAQIQARFGAAHANPRSTVRIISSCE